MLDSYGGICTHVERSICRPHVTGDGLLLQIQGHRTTDTFRNVKYVVMKVCSKAFYCKSNLPCSKYTLYSNIATFFHHQSYESLQRTSLIFFFPQEAHLDLQGGCGFTNIQAIDFQGSSSSDPHWFGI